MRNSRYKHESTEVNGFLAPGSNHQALVHENLRHFLELLAGTRVIAAVRDPKDVELAATSKPRIVDLLCGAPDNIKEMAERLLEAGKFPVANIDLLAGFARDSAAVKYIVSCGIRGIISTHIEPLRAAHCVGAVAIQRTFMLDSAALHSSLRSLENFVPDALEVLPAMAAPYLLSKIPPHQARLPILAGGLVESFRQIEELVGKGVSAISVSNPGFWVME